MREEHQPDRQDMLQPVRDPGLQPERTALAWSRTAMAVLVNAVFALRAGFVNQQRSIICLGFMLLVAAAVLTAFSSWRKACLQRSMEPVPAAAVVLATTAFTLLAGVTAIGTMALKA